VGILVVSTFLNTSGPIENVLLIADDFLCAFFFCDFIHSLICAKSKWKYFITWGWIDLISSVPNIAFLRYGRFARITRILRVLRGTRSIRTIIKMILRYRAQSAMLASILIFVTFILFGSVGVLQFENDPESNIRTAGDAIWWAIATMTTVGYGDVYPVTAEGRTLGIVLMIAGVGIFGTVTGLIASLFFKTNAKTVTNEDIMSELKALRTELEKGKSEILNKDLMQIRK